MCWSRTIHPRACEGMSLSWEITFEYLVSPLGSIPKKQEGKVQGKVILHGLRMQAPHPWPPDWCLDPLFTVPRVMLMVTAIY